MAGWDTSSAPFQVTLVSDFPTGTRNGMKDFQAMTSSRCRMAPWSRDVKFSKSKDSLHPFPWA